MAKPRRTSAPAGDLAEYQAKRDFGKTPEPRGARARKKKAAGLGFVVQKHAASHLHFDLRLELGGVMKSWAVPKGPSGDPADRRLAVEVEDHPMEYNTFEGTIPAGEYGGGTVMLWDRGTYTADDVLPNEDPEEFLAAQHRKGKLDITFHGERLRGSYALVRTRRGEGSSKPQWLLIKHRDDHSGDGLDPAAEYDTSVETGRTMEEIASGRGGRRVWRSNRATSATPPPQAVPAAAPTPVVLPMLASSAGGTVPSGEGWTFEPKYDGIRVLAFVGNGTAALVTRNGNDKARQFPEVVEALLAFRQELGRDVVLDGELIGVRNGEVVRFESLQGRMHLTNDRDIASSSAREPAALVAFDLLLDGTRPLLREPWSERREALEELLEGRATDVLRLGESSADVDEMMSRARAGGWEGLVAKRTSSGYAAGKRSRDWIKLKLENRQELVVGGWTEPRNSRQHVGALLLGYYDAEGRFVYAGHTGTGFDQKGLADAARRMKPLERKTSPFVEKPATNEKAHWVTPKLVVEIRFNEWTSAGKLRQPVFLGFRDDKDPRSVVREPDARVSAAEPEARDGAPAPRHAAGSVAERLDAIEREGGDGVVALGKGKQLSVSNLGKVYFPADGITKGDLLRYYAETARYILPAMKDRPLVLRRFPNGIEGQAFYQQTPDADTPDGVRVETIREPDGDLKRRLIGGDLATLLYTVQLGAISYDPWHSRVDGLDYADYSILDLDPGEGTDFQTVVEVALLVKQELDRAGLHGALKTSGSSGLHIYLPLPARTPLETSTLLAQFIATRVAGRAPKIATIERMVKRRPRGTVYVDYLQNILGKTVAGVYAVRAKQGGTVSTPLSWDELTDDLDLHAFTLRTLPARLAERGDLWGPAMKRPIPLRRFLRAAPAA
jgi:bifunctional non-homologous end joining protein LigD